MRKINRFLFNIFLFLCPIFIVLIIYVIIDPFRIFHVYNNYYPKEDCAVVIDMDNVSIENYHHYKDVYHYDSFIIGNSRSRFWDIVDWEKFLPEESSCYHVECYGERLYSLTIKLEYIGKNCPQIKNAIFTFDDELLSGITPHEEYIGYLSPRATGYSNLVGFHISHLKAFLNPFFLYALFDYKISGKIKPYMLEHHLMTNNFGEYDSIHNQVLYTEIEKQIGQNKYYTNERIQRFKYVTQEKGKELSPIIEEKRLALLYRIKNVLEKHKTDYRIVINPLYYQRKLNHNDVAVLKRIFGESNVFDFSGVNWITTDYHNYYEESHYRPHVAKWMIQQLYKTKGNNICE